MSIILKNISKRFGTYAALHDVSLEARDGEFLALLGPSGSGKTTLLRIIAGLEFPDEGRVFFGDEDVTDLKAAARRVGFVFQQYALFKHMTVAENVAFGLNVRKRRDRPPTAEIKRRVEELLDLVQLGGRGDRYPAQLSGGQRQRIALARALAVEPRLLLLDEPFGALDAKVRKELRRWLRTLHDSMGVTSVFVTHDQDEALELADRVVVMDYGRIEQVARPRTIYDRPENAFVYDFVGDSNRLPVEVVAERGSFAGRPLAVVLDGASDGPANLWFRPHEVRLTENPDGALEGRVTLILPRAGTLRVEAEVDGIDRPVELDLPLDAPVKIGDVIRFVPTEPRMFPKAD
ncbi:sulfate/molybdate ABC transporter ATP-binding protein [Sphingomonas sp.]|uniref:sulfate/molybdate ABC transporter ATP-binding protein n=1 Tax=Sphingomonas sp. TaxID=28214 RepID=UPI0025F06846|nr:sulfate/molybdate ABC transporter ATP-binding protein [Sphingomonas sp.]